MRPKDYEISQAEKAAYRRDEFWNDLRVVTGGRLVAHLLSRARKEAGIALDALVDADPTEPKLIQKLQNEVQRYRDLVRWIGQAFVEGDEAERFLSEIERAENVQFLEDIGVHGNSIEEGVDQ
jgi:hypothetical protein